jgi:ABC-type uncharacterized transport system permease subunit
MFTKDVDAKASLSVVMVLISPSKGTMLRWFDWIKTLGRQGLVTITKKRKTGVNFFKEQCL